jgi:transposase InsO family protein
MPWKELNVKDQRMEFSFRAMEESVPFVELCRQYNISRKTGYKWKQRFIQEGLAGLEERSRRPHHSPSGLSEDVVCRIVRLKKKLKWGPRKVRDVYSRRYAGEELPSESSFKRVLEKAGYVKKRRRRRSQDSGSIQNRVVSQKPNHVWTVDFKGWWYTPAGERCEPLTVRDDYSRYVFSVAVLEDARTETVRAEFERVFTRYGLPDVIRSDNGRPFASTAPLGLSRLSVWWLALGIDLDRIDKGCPSQNGRHERLHRDMACELERQIEGNLAEHAAVMEVWRQEFNCQRPHQALGMRRPAEVYEASSRRYQGTPDQLEYPSGYRQRKVHSKGHIKIEGATIRLTTALGGWNVGLKAVGPNSYRVYFANLCLGWIDLETESFQTTDDPNKENNRDVA